MYINAITSPVHSSHISIPLKNFRSHTFKIKTLRIYGVAFLIL